MRLALFDFDGTITKKDSLEKFIRFIVGDFKFFKGVVVLLPILIAYKMKIIPNYRAKEILLSYFFKGISEERFLQISKQYSLEHIDTIVRPKAMEKINWHKQQGHKVVVVSASMECWLKAWCSKNELELIATKIEIKDKIVTGNLSTKNCYGTEKVKRLKEKYNLNRFEYIYAYGDSDGDKEMMNIANEAHYNPF